MLRPVRQFPEITWTMRSRAAWPVMRWWPESWPIQPDWIQMNPMRPPARRCDQAVAQARTQ
uniref:Uncharacterized protein n=1 Tax=Arundo donax TaxID=35708 RepID=A0A0A9GK22_ARUDO